MGQDLVDHHIVRIGKDAAVILSGRAAGVCTRTPGVFLVPTVRVGIARIYYSQRKILAVGNRVPSIFIVKVQNRPANRIGQRDSLAGIVQSAGVFTGYFYRRAVTCPKGIAVLGYYALFIGCKLKARESEIDAVREAYQIQVDCLCSDVL